jgi:hypothetical protein
MIAGGGAAYLTGPQRQGMSQFAGVLDSTQRRIEAAMGDSMLGGEDIRGVNPIPGVAAAQRMADHVGIGDGSAVALNQARESLVQAYAQMVSGLGYTDGQLEQLRDVIAGADTDAELMNAMQLMRERLNAIASGRVTPREGGQRQPAQDPGEGLVDYD